MSVESVKEFMKKFNLEDKIMEFDESSATVFLAANAIGCSESEILKSLSFKLDNKYIVIAVSGDSKIDNKKFKSVFNKKAKLLNYDEVEDAIGHKVGGVCPFVLNEGVELFLDCSLKKHKYIYPACGSENSAIKLSINQLEEITDYPLWVDVCKVVENV